MCTDFENRGVVKARITSTDPEVAGSIPAVGESRRSSVAEHWTQKLAVPRIPPAKVCGVAQARVTSHQRLRVRVPPAAKAAVAQMAEQR